jgi:hypothetical protein
MSKYLDDLIKSLQAEAKEHKASLEQRVPTRRGFRRDRPALRCLVAGSFAKGAMRNGSAEGGFR